jgi:hypothetical protein
MINQILFSFLFILFGCTNTVNKKLTDGKQNTNLTTNYIQLCYGIDTKVDTSNLMELAMDLLNKSDYSTCLKVLQKINGKIDTVYWHSGFYALIVSDSNIHSYEGAKIGYNDPINYLSFRYNNFIGDIANDEQSILFQNSVDANSTDELFKLQNIEWGTLYDNFRVTDLVGSKAVIQSANRLKEAYPQSKRLDFLLAVSYLKIGEEKKAIKLFDNLISKNYYAMPSLKMIIEYYGKSKRISEQEKYVSFFKVRFPNLCLITYNNLQNLPQLAIEICKNCVRNGTQRDSINANINLAKYGLESRNFEIVDSVTSIFFNKPETDPSYDSLKTYEEEIYPDIKMRSLFLRGEYGQIINYFSSPATGEERKVEFDAKMELYYNEYQSKGFSSFQSFYLKFFPQ